MTTLTLKLKVVEKDGRGVYVLAHRAGTVYLTRATTDGKMPGAITLQAEGLVEDKPVPEADKKAVQIERLKAQLAKLEAAPVAAPTPIGTAHLVPTTPVGPAAQVPTATPASLLVPKAKKATKKDRDARA